MTDNEKDYEKDYVEFKRKVRTKLSRTWRHITRRLSRETRWEIRGLFFALLGAVIAAIIYVVFDPYAGAIESHLEPNTILSIFVADIPVGIVLYLILQRRESKNRSLLDAIEIVESPQRFTHLEIHNSDSWEDYDYPDKHYYVVNMESKPRKAFWVSDTLHELVKSRIVRKEPAHDSLEELTRFFDHNGIEIVPDYPRGDDLFRKS